MKQPRVDVGTIRREQITDAAVAIIADQGIQHLSLSEIETRAGMSRGQLTYYFKTKEDILLAVFDRLLQQMRERALAGDGSGKKCPMHGTGWERLEPFLSFFLLTPPAAPEFHALQYTFLSQIGHREDFRQRLASLYEEWRSHMAKDLDADLKQRSHGPAVSPRTFASLIQSILHGLAMQRAADPGAYDRQEMHDLCLHLLSSFLRPAPDARNGHSSAHPEPAAGSRRAASRPERSED
jgi:AcrR family transcriptional regulator